MEFVLSFNPLSPFHRAFHNHTFYQHEHEDSDSGSVVTVCRHSVRDPFDEGLSHRFSGNLNSTYTSQENTPPARPRSSLNFVKREKVISLERKPTSASLPSRNLVTKRDDSDEISTSLDENTPCSTNSLEYSNEDAADGSRGVLKDLLPTPAPSLAETIISLSDKRRSAPTLGDIHGVGTRPFKRWLSTLRKRRQNHSLSVPDLALNEGAPEGSRARKSMSEASSEGLIDAVNSATATLFSTSITQSENRIGRLGRLRRNTTSNRPSDETSNSCDSWPHMSAAVIDRVTWSRAVQRRKILEELIESEESYVADLKILVNV